MRVDRTVVLLAKEHCYVVTMHVTDTEKKISEQNECFKH